jgi:hypothetical protein
VIAGDVAMGPGRQTVPLWAWSRKYADNLDLAAVAAYD